jgi:putative transposase
VAQAVEAEAATLLSRYADETTDDGRKRLVRHGHLPEREIMTGIGPVAVRCLRVRDRTSGKGAGASVSRQQGGRNPSAQ